MPLNRNGMPVRAMSAPNYQQPAMAKDAKMGLIAAAMNSSQPSVASTVQPPPQSMSVPAAPMSPVEPSMGKPMGGPGQMKPMGSNAGGPNPYVAPSDTLRR